MSDRSGSVVGEDDFAGTVEDALREGVQYRERSDDRIVEVAERARGMATELTDRAFATALRSTLDGFHANWDLKCEVMVLAEQFAHLAGARSFSSRTHSLLADLRHRVHDTEGTSREPVSDRAYPAFRAYLLALARTIGMSVTVQDMEREELLRKQEPTLWMDLATECLARSAYIDSVRDLLENDAFSLFDLVRRLPMIVQHQGVPIAQEVLEAACRHLYGRGKYDDAWSLIMRAEDFESRGWRLPPSGRAVEFSDLGTARDYTQALLFDPLEFSNADAVRIVERFRSHMTSHFALIDDDRGECERSEEEQDAREAEEERRMHLRNDIFKKLPYCRDYEKILMTMIQPEFRHVDASGCDWWQDFSLAVIDLNTGDGDFPNVIHGAGKTIGPVDDNRTNESSTEAPSKTDRPARSGQLEDALMRNAAAAGF